MMMLKDRVTFGIWIAVGVVLLLSLMFILYNQIYLH